MSPTSIVAANSNFRGTAAEVIQGAIQMLNDGLPSGASILLIGVAHEAVTGDSMPLLRYLEGHFTSKPAGLNRVLEKNGARYYDNYPMQGANGQPPAWPLSRFARGPSFAQSGPIDCGLGIDSHGPYVLFGNSTHYIAPISANPENMIFVSDNATPQFSGPDMYQITRHYTLSLIDRAFGQERRVVVGLGSKRV